MPTVDNFPPEPVPRRRAPAGQALLVMLVALLVGSVLNAERLDYTARTQPFGWQRTVAMHITGPLAAVSRGIGLTGARRYLAEHVGPCANPKNSATPPCTNKAPEPAADDPNVKLADEVAKGGASGPGAGPTTTTTSIPPRIPTAADPLKVLVVGDSLMGWIGPGLVKQLDGKPVTVTEDWKISTGLARPDVLDWPEKIKQDIATYDPDVVVAGFGGNDAQDMETADGRVTVGTKEWRLEYERRIVQVLDAIEGEGRTAYWVGLPITTRDAIEKAAPAMTRAAREEIAIRPWAHYVNSRKALSPKGKYVAELPDGKGGMVKVREDDGVHPNPAGGERIVKAFIETLIEERNLDAPPPTTTTTSTTGAPPGN